MVLRPQLQQVDTSSNECCRDFYRPGYLDVAKIKNAVKPAATEVGGGQGERLFVEAGRRRPDVEIV